MRNKSVELVAWEEWWTESILKHLNYFKNTKVKLVSKAVSFVEIAGVTGDT